MGHYSAYVEKWTTLNTEVPIDLIVVTWEAVIEWTSVLINRRFLGTFSQSHSLTCVSVSL